MFCHFSRCWQMQFFFPEGDALGPPHLLSVMLLVRSHSISFHLTTAFWPALSRAMMIGIRNQFFLTRVSLSTTVCPRGKFLPPTGSAWRLLALWGATAMAMVSAAQPPPYDIDWSFNVQDSSLPKENCAIVALANALANLDADLKSVGALGVLPNELVPVAQEIKIDQNGNHVAGWDGTKLESVLAPNMAMKDGQSSSSNIRDCLEAYWKGENLDQRPYTLVYRTHGVDHSWASLSEEVLQSGWQSMVLLNSADGYAHWVTITALETGSSPPPPNPSITVMDPNIMYQVQEKYGGDQYQVTVRDGRAYISYSLLGDPPSVKEYELVDMVSFRVVVPEPTTLTLLSLGSLALVIVRRSR
jgi:hypothetical protein